jgi:hypothetical protein
MQMSLIDQPSVFGWEPFYQNSLSRAWIASSTIAVRNDYTDQYIWAWAEIATGRNMGIDLVEWAKSLQANFLSPATSTAISPVDILTAFSDKLFVSTLFQTQKDFLIDTIMMQGIPRTSWTFEWNAFRTVSNTPSDATYTDKFNTVRWRLQLLMRFMLKMAEYHVF